MQIRILYSIKLAFIGWLCVFIAGCSFFGKKAESSSIPDKIAESTAGILLSQTPAPTPPQYNEYTVKLDIQPSERLVTGVEKIRVINSSNCVLDMVYINVPLNAFSEDASILPVFNEFLNKVYPNGINYGYMKFNNVYVDGEAVEFELNDTVLSISLPEALPQNEWTELKLDLEAKIPIMNNRIGSDETSMWFGNFIPTVAVRDADGWHTDPYYSVGDPFFSRAANYSVSITTPLEYTVAGPGIPLVTDSDDKETTEFTLKLARDFAFALSSHYNISTFTSPSNVEISLYTFSDSTRDEEILNLASQSLEYYISRVGSYPYSQLAVIETKLFNRGGMEYPGVIFLDSDYMQSSENLGSLTHEIGHQWFYNIIGSNQIENAWMDEGLDSFIEEGFLLNDSELDRKMNTEYNSLKRIISQIKPNTLNSSLDEYQSWSDYYNIQYLRGKLMFYSLYKKIGKEAFNSFLTEYNRRFSFRISSPNNLIQTAEDISGMDLSAFFSAWINDPVLPPLIEG